MYMVYTQNLCNVTIKRCTRHSKLQNIIKRICLTRLYNIAGVFEQPINVTKLLQSRQICSTLEVVFAAAISGRPSNTISKWISKFETGMNFALFILPVRFTDKIFAECAYLKTESNTLCNLKCT